MFKLGIVFLSLITVFLTFVSGASGSTAPSGYGSCSSGQYWNGSSCTMP